MYMCINVRSFSTFFPQEFVQFLIYAFGDELEFAWEELDDDGSGELSEDEWFQAVKRIGRWELVDLNRCWFLETTFASLKGNVIMLFKYIFTKPTSMSVFF